jgi:hypothetical protein
MRIKMYENFTESNNDIVRRKVSFMKKFKSGAEDIFVELLDDHFLVDVDIVAISKDSIKGYFKCFVVIQLSNISNKETFRFEDIRDSLVMFEDYTNEYVNKDFEIEMAYHEDNSEYGFTDVVKSFENFGGDMDWLESADMNRLKIEVYVKND